MGDKNSNSKPKNELRKFAIIIFFALGIIGVFIFRKKSEIPYVLWGFGSTILAVGLIRPAILNPIYRVWMAFAAILRFMNTHILLAIMYYLVFTPIGIVMRFLGKNTVRNKIDRDAKTYFIKKHRGDQRPERYEKMF